MGTQQTEGSHHVGLRSVAVRTMRRAGLVPGGQADLLGEDESVVDEVFPQRVMVFFPDPPENLYQVEQWLDPLEALNEQHGVVLICQDSRTAKAIRSRTDLECRVIARNRTLHTVVRNSRFGLCLYVGQANANAVALRQNRLMHVFLSHGESDKLVTVSNLEKSFDQIFVAGDAAIDRHRRALMFFDESRLVRIGRPQAREVLRAGGGPFTVLYAPTWEGTQTANAYSSLLTHARGILGGADAEARVIFRPHPRTGRSDIAYRDELAALIRSDAWPRGAVQVDTSTDPVVSMAKADVMITDVSAMAVDWLATGRPLILTSTGRKDAAVVDSVLLATMPRLTAADAENAVALAKSLVDDADHAAAISAARAHYLGDLVGRAALHAFLDACTEALRLRDEAWAKIESQEKAP